MPDASSPQASETPQPEERVPFFRAPLIVVVVALGLVLLHLAFTLMPFEQQQAALYEFALAPQRFWAPVGSPDVYPDHLSGLMTLVSTALLHFDWAHVLINSGMLLAFGTPVARTFGSSLKGAGLWMIVFLGSVIGGSALFLALATEATPYAIGASGGTSGLIAAALLLDPWGMKRALWSREFLLMTFGLLVANVVLTLAGPMIFGMGIAWEAHAGGYIAGALLMTVLPVRGYQRPES
jgi:membrane associated rhomboid family serine protease